MPKEKKRRLFAVLIIGGLAVLSSPEWLGYQIAMARDPNQSIAIVVVFPPYFDRIFHRRYILCWNAPILVHCRIYPLMEHMMDQLCKTWSFDLHHLANEANVDRSMAAA